MNASLGTGAVSLHGLMALVFRGKMIYMYLCTSDTAVFQFDAV